MKQKHGFSIVEILVALAIMAIVAGVSVPNYTRMKRASKKAEAQSSLGQIYIAEKAFFLQWRYYTVDLVTLGAIPEGPLTYNVGFSGNGVIQCPDPTKPCTPTDYRGPKVTATRNNFYDICGQTFKEDPAQKTQAQCAFSYKKKNEYKGFTPPLIPDKTQDGITSYNAEQKKFIAGAIADLINRCIDTTSCIHHLKLDKWSINQFKQVKRECGDQCPY